MKGNVSLRSTSPKEKKTNLASLIILKQRICEVNKSSRKDIKIIKQKKMNSDGNLRGEKK